MKYSSTLIQPIRGDMPYETSTFLAAVESGLHPRWYIYWRMSGTSAPTSWESERLDGVEKDIGVGGMVSMKAGCWHTVLALDELKIIEVQIGQDINVEDKRIMKK